MIGPSPLARISGLKHFDDQPQGVKHFSLYTPCHIHMSYICLPINVYLPTTHLNMYGCLQFTLYVLIYAMQLCNTQKLYRSLVKSCGLQPQGVEAYAWLTWVCWLVSLWTWPTRHTWKEITSIEEVYQTGPWVCLWGSQGKPGRNVPSWWSLLQFLPQCSCPAGVPTLAFYNDRL